MNITAVEIEPGQWLLDCDQCGVLGITDDASATAHDHIHHCHEDP